jgi:hypothetical protein
VPSWKEEKEDILQFSITTTGWHPRYMALHGSISQHPHPSWWPEFHTIIALCSVILEPGYQDLEMNMSKTNV